jgi:catechol 2,3-dioxygenase-like lactoylglutathione lyase family enzyme
LRPRIRLDVTVLGASNPRELASFYERLLGWQRGADEKRWVTLLPKPLGTGLAFMLEPDFVPPVWPPVPGEQQMNAHLDIAVDDLESAVAWAVELGARIADHQPQDDVKVMLDPVGHLFCLFVGDFNS